MKTTYLLVDYSIKPELNNLSDFYHSNNPDNALGNFEIFVTSKPQDGFITEQKRKHLIEEKMKAVAERFGAVVSLEANCIMVKENVEVFDLDQIGESFELKKLKKM